MLLMMRWVENCTRKNFHPTTFSSYNSCITNKVQGSRFSKIFNSSRFTYILEEEVFSGWNILRQVDASFSERNTQFFSLYKIGK